MVTIPAFIQNMYIMILVSSTHSVSQSEILVCLILHQKIIHSLTVLKKNKNEFSKNCHVSVI